MNTPQNNGGAAFPHEAVKWNSDAGIYVKDCENYHPGMTLRDYFAAAALQGLLASGHFTHDSNEYSDCGPWMTSHEDIYDDETGEPIHKGRTKFDFPEAAWRCADKMLAERDRL